MLALFAVLTVAAVLAACAALIALHMFPTGLAPLRDPVSAYGISRYRSLYRVQTVATAIGAAALAGALAEKVPGACAPAVVALVVLAVARALISWFPMDAPDTARTTTGRVHNLLAFGAFAAASVSGFMVAIAFSDAAGLQWAAPTASLLGWGMTLASALTLAATSVPRLRPFFGLFERLIYVGMFALLAFAATALLAA